MLPQALNLCRVGLFVYWQFCQKQRFHISRSFSPDTCQGNRQNKECRAETAYKSVREKRNSVDQSFFDWSTLFVESETISLFSHAFISGLSSIFFILTIPLTSVRRKASGNMKPLLLAIFKFCTTNRLDWQFCST